MRGVGVTDSNPDAVAAAGKRSHYMASQEAGTSENGNEWGHLSDGGHRWLSESLFCRFIITSGSKAKAQRNPNLRSFSPRFTNSQRPISLFPRPRAVYEGPPTGEEGNPMQFTL